MGGMRGHEGSKSASAAGACGRVLKLTGRREHATNGSEGHRRDELADRHKGSLPQAVRWSFLFGLCHREVYGNH